MKSTNILKVCCEHWRKSARRKHKFILFLVFVLFAGAWGIYYRSGVLTAAPSGVDLSESAGTLTNPENVERFLGLDKVEAFSHQQVPLESSAGKNSLDPVDLKLTDAIDLTIKNHLLSREAQERIEASLGRRWQSASPLLPSLDASAFQQRTYKENLAALGFNGVGVIGPFNTFDARFRLVQKILDLSALSGFKAGSIDVDVARYGQELAHQKVILIASMAYLDALRAQGAFKAAQANLELSERLLKQAKNQMEAGIATNVDVARAQTRVAQDKLRLAKSSKGLHDTYLELQRVTGLSYDSTIQLLNSLCFIKETMPSLKEALVTASAGRIEMRIAKEKIHASQYRLYGARAQMLPKLEFAGDYGWSGNEADQGGGSRPVGSAMLRVTLPLFEGGMIHGEVKEAASQKRQEEIYYDDLKRQVEEDVYMALWTIETSLEQVNAAGQVVELSQRELELASHRFSEGVGDNVEVVNAQTVLEQSRDEYIVALTQYHAARINWYFALGKADSFHLKDTTRKGSH